MSKPKVTHFASIEQATESDNTTWVYILCDPRDEKYGYEDPEYGDVVTCKRCLKILERE